MLSISTRVRVRKYDGIIHSNRKKYKYIVITECDLIFTSILYHKGKSLKYINVIYKRCSRAGKKGFTNKTGGNKLEEDLQLLRKLLEELQVFGCWVRFLWGSGIWTHRCRVVTK